ncbi:MAG: 30S ribosomal protein S17 [bacterium (Candidatus Ratteibacteria) CG23_combo_of_CG06-09_8_20_14_all_48_7]|uniref:Small ribosomal subunit protein uS17 n=1 Tax=bacterium (Candidatus Ratteibacteria) CG23_combo_of_CG06-09_8_20_14_all_48_7 TaxID=2014292 RepID=A0A2G9Y8B4_9BACT|nr:MAG: 30S ribosomal protein S17 [bacterium (Candidatus Ratteibacteria) CG23_combo_of_CG06-09_8_20_14_all_48_7]
MKKRLEGTVVSDRMDKTRVVLVTRSRIHPMYHKELKKSERYKVDDPRNESRTGDRILIEECRPLSREKHWRLLKVIKSNVDYDGTVEDNLGGGG